MHPSRKQDQDETGFCLKESTMKPATFREEQIAAILKEEELGAEREKACSRHGFSEDTNYNWKTMQRARPEISRSQWPTMR